MNALAFELPGVLEAREPPEERGVPATQSGCSWRQGRAARSSTGCSSTCPPYLDPGDLLVVNVSATLPAAVGASREDGSRVRVHFATRAPGLDERWRVVEVRSADGSRPRGGHTGEQLDLDGGASLQLVAPYASGARLMLARFDGLGAVRALPRAPRHTDPLRPRAARMAAVRLPERLRDHARERRDAERRPAVHRRADHALHRRGV